MSINKKIIAGTAAALLFAPMGMTAVASAEPTTTEISPITNLVSASLNTISVNKHEPSKKAVAEKDGASIEIDLDSTLKGLTGSLDSLKKDKKTKAVKEESTPAGSISSLKDGGVEIDLTSLANLLQKGSSDKKATGVKEDSTSGSLGSLGSLSKSDAPVLKLGNDFDLAELMEFAKLTSDSLKTVNTSIKTVNSSIDGIKGTDNKTEAKSVAETEKEGSSLEFDWDSTLKGLKEVPLASLGIPNKDKKVEKTAKTEKKEDTSILASLGSLNKDKKVEKVAKTEKTEDTNLLASLGSLTKDKKAQKVAETESEGRSLEFDWDSTLKGLKEVPLASLGIPNNDKKVEKTAKTEKKEISILDTIKGLVSGSLGSLDKKAPEAPGVTK